MLPAPLNTPLSPAAILGGLLIIGAFIVLSVATYREMDEERKKEADRDELESNIDEEENGLLSPPAR